MSGISTHVLDTANGRPAIGVIILLEMVAADGASTVIRQTTTDDEGRVSRVLPEGFAFLPGTYRLTFDTQSYFASRNVECFYPSVTVLFKAPRATEHYHIPLLLSPFGYSTYRGT
jgi:5-hydroxyisourate hydrolase